MRNAQHAVAIGLVLCLVGAVYLSFRDVVLPDAPLIDPSIKQGEPRQESSDLRPFTVTIKGYTYTLTPKASYDISGLVVSQHRGDALFNLYHKADPGNIKDVCVAWGEAITNGSYQKVKFSSEEFTCYYSWSGVLVPPFKHEKMSNNHLIPATAAVAKAIDAIRVGDQIWMKGLLVDYTVTQDRREIFTRRTSLSRNDTGNGACEILYVTDLSVVAPGNHLAADAPRYAWYLSAVLFVALGTIWFVRPPIVT